MEPVEVEAVPPVLSADRGCGPLCGELCHTGPQTCDACRRPLYFLHRYVTGDAFGGVCHECSNSTPAVRRWS